MAEAGGEVVVQTAETPIGNHKNTKTDSGRVMQSDYIISTFFSYLSFGSSAVGFFFFWCLNITVCLVQVQRDRRWLNVLRNGLLSMSGSLWDLLIFHFRLTLTKY